jgi:hypothetical protein
LGISSAEKLNNDKEELHHFSGDSRKTKLMNVPLEIESDKFAL